MGVEDILDKVLIALPECEVEVSLAYFFWIEPPSYLENERSPLVEKLTDVNITSPENFGQKVAAEKIYLVPYFKNHEKSYRKGANRAQLIGTEIKVYVEGKKNPDFQIFINNEGKYDLEIYNTDNKIKKIADDVTKCLGEENKLDVQIGVWKEFSLDVPNYGKIKVRC
ncbi:MAG: hypothetical protein QXQ79_02660 [Candidatus Nanoarchaeia archaeon]